MTSELNLILSRLQLVSSRLQFISSRFQRRSLQEDQVSVTGACEGTSLRGADVTLQATCSDQLQATASSVVCAAFVIEASDLSINNFPFISARLPRLLRIVLLLLKS